MMADYYVIFAILSVFIANLALLITILRYLTFCEYQICVFRTCKSFINLFIHSFIYYYLQKQQYIVHKYIFAQCVPFSLLLFIQPLKAQQIIEAPNMVLYNWPVGHTVIFHGKSKIKVIFYVHFCIHFSVWKF